MRENTAALKPPRALWVPFELGRPLGAPNEPAFQTKVLKAALKLLESDGGPPLLADFPEDAPKTATGEAPADWICPVSFPPPPNDDSALLQSFLAEIESLKPWHNVALENNGRTTVGLSGLDIGDAVRFLTGLTEGERKNPLNNATLAEAVKRTSEDVKAFYLESVAAQPSGATSRDIYGWFWRETVAGDVFRRIQKVFLTTKDEHLQYLVTRSLVP
ncbi:MAG: hypothetical protein RIB59_03670, partial [Rhodospirillales bacterium]